MSMTNQYLPAADPRRNSVRWLALVALVGALAAGCSNGKAKDKDRRRDREECDRAGRGPAPEARRDGGRVLGHRTDRGPRGSHGRRQGRRRGAADLRRGRRHGAGGPGAGAARRRPPAPHAGPDGRQPAQARARLQAHARTRREGSRAEEHGREHQVRPRRPARRVRQRPPRTELHRDPRADQRRHLGAQDQGRQYHRPERSDVHGHRPRSRCSPSCTCRRRNSASSRRGRTPKS